MGNIVIGVDSSTQSTKAIAWDINGNVLAEGRCDIPLNNPSLEKFMKIILFIVVQNILFMPFQRALEDTSHPTMFELLCFHQEI